MTSWMSYSHVEAADLFGGSIVRSQLAAGTGPSLLGDRNDAKGVGSV